VAWLSDWSGPTESSQGTYVVSVDGYRKLKQVWKLSLICCMAEIPFAWLIATYRSSTLLGGECECAGTDSDVQLLSQIDRAAPLIDSSRTFSTPRDGEAKQENPDSSPDLDPVDGKLYANVQFRRAVFDYLFIETKSDLAATVQTYKA
jgi:hypothetical protein